MIVNKNKSWRKRKLCEAAYEVRDTYDPKSDEHLSYVGLEHIEQNSLRLNGLGKSSDTKSTKKIFKDNDILFGSLRPYFRKVVKPRFSGVCSTDITVIRSKDNFSQDYFFYFIANKDFIDHATNCSYGTKMPRASWKVLEKSEWDFPPYSIQMKIGSILSTYDDLIEINDRRIKILEELAQLIYKEWFVKFRFPGHEKVRMLDSKLGKIPEGWKVKKLEEVLKGLESGRRPKGGVGELENGIPSIGAENILGLGIYDYSKEKYVSHDFFNSMKKGIVHNKDVLLYKDGAKIGRKTMFRDGFPHKICCINEHAFILRTENESYQNYLFFWLDQDWMTNKIKNLNTNAAQPGINQGDVKSLPILIPKKDIILEFDIIIENFLSELFMLAKQKLILKKTRDLLLPKMINGEIKVD